MGLQKEKNDTSHTTTCTYYANVTCTVGNFLVRNTQKNTQNKNHELISSCFSDKLLLVFE